LRTIGARPLPPLVSAPVGLDCSASPLLPVAWGTATPLRKPWGPPSILPVLIELRLHVVPGAVAVVSYHKANRLCFARKCRKETSVFGFLPWKCSCHTTRMKSWGFHFVVASDVQVSVTWGARHLYHMFNKKGHRLSWTTDKVAPEVQQIPRTGAGKISARMIIRMRPCALSTRLWIVNKEECYP